MLQQISLLDYFHQYYCLQRPLRPSSIYQQDRSLRVFTGWLGRDPPLHTITADLISRFLREMGPRYSAQTLKRYRTNLLSLLRVAERAGLCELPRDVRPVRAPPPIPTAWTVEEVRQLLTACRQLRYHGQYLERFIRTCWDTGLRHEDLELLDLRCFRSDGRGVIRQDKTLDPVLVTLQLETMEALRRADSDRPLKCPIDSKHIYYWWKKLCKLADVSYGGPQKMRRSAATNVHCHRPGGATAFLGHRTPELAMRHYIDPRIASVDPPRPEAL